MSLSFLDNQPTPIIKGIHFNTTEVNLLIFLFKTKAFAIQNICFFLYTALLVKKENPALLTERVLILTVQSALC